jgi:hypothetical protein
MLCCVQVELVQETPGWLQLSVAGLQKPLELTYWQREDVLRVKVSCCMAASAAVCCCCCVLFCNKRSRMALQMSTKPHQCCQSCPTLLLSLLQVVVPPV